jgi:hypothetical protein
MNVGNFLTIREIVKFGNKTLTRKLFLNRKLWEELIAYFPLIRHGAHNKGNN